MQNSFIKSLFFISDMLIQNGLGGRIAAFIIILKWN